jgi:transcription initiation factor TFIIIB Brf1 subunit/transcription initiation factor TFIIB
VKQFCQKLNIKDSAKAKADILVAKVEDSGKLKGKNMNAKIAAILAVACLQCQQSRTMKFFIKNIDCTQKDMNKCFKIIKQDVLGTMGEIRKIKPSDIVDTACNKMNMQQCHIETIKKLADNIEKKEIGSGKQP